MHTGLIVFIIHLFMIHSIGICGIMILIVITRAGRCRLAGDGIIRITGGDTLITGGDIPVMDGVILVTDGDIIRHTTLVTRFIREVVMLITSTDKEDQREPM